MPTRGIEGGGLKGCWGCYDGDIGLMGFVFSAREPLGTMMGRAWTTKADYSWWHHDGEGAELSRDGRHSHLQGALQSGVTVGAMVRVGRPLTIKLDRGQGPGLSFGSGMQQA